LTKIDLTYCTNVHALGTANAWYEALGFFGKTVGKQLGWATMPMGLWWQAPLAEAAAHSPHVVQEFMAQHGLRAFTCNAFPYGNFHDTVVKTKVYLPDWTSLARLTYTQNCALALAALLPDRGFGSISTLPLGWRLGWTSQHTVAAVAHLLAWVAFARDLENKTGKHLALALEPEPGCALERTFQVLKFWELDLLPSARHSGHDAYLSRYLGICYDTCHQAVQFEQPEESLGALRDAGIAIHKMQLSSALEFLPDYDGSSRALREAFAEPKFLHQTRVFTQATEGSAAGGTVTDYDDLPLALAEAPWNARWRTHYHLPLQAESLLGSSVVRTTREDMLRAYHFALKNDLCHHFEVETYTWSVLPESERPATDVALAMALAKELAFVIAHTPKDVVIEGMGGSDQG
jgi:hypothetical protein